MAHENARYHVTKYPDPIKTVDQQVWIVSYSYNKFKDRKYRVFQTQREAAEFVETMAAYDPKLNEGMMERHLMETR